MDYKVSGISVCLGDEISPLSILSLMKESTAESFRRRGKPIWVSGTMGKYLYVLTTHGYMVYYRLYYRRLKPLYVFL